MNPWVPIYVVHPTSIHAYTGRHFNVPDYGNVLHLLAQFRLAERAARTNGIAAIRSFISAMVVAGSFALLVPDNQSLRAADRSARCRMLRTRSSTLRRPPGRRRAA